MQLQTPDVTKAQILAIVQPFITFAVAFGLFDLNPDRQAAVIGIAGAVSSAIVLADAIIRNGRAKVAAAAVATRAYHPPVPAEPDATRSAADVPGGRSV